MTKRFEYLSSILKDFETEKEIFYKDENFIGSNKTFSLINKLIPDFYFDDTNTNEVTQKQEKFYNEIKFPNYDDLDDFSSLIDKAKKSIFAKLLDEQITFGSKVLEVGCGTGQLSNFLSRYNRKIFGIDLSESSLLSGERFRLKADLESVYFCKMNLFNLLFKDNFFDYIISIGCLHHTSDPKRAFFSIEKKLKPNGYIVIGLYHKYGRIFTKLRAKVFKLFGEKAFFLDRYLRDNNISYEKKMTWFRDQYQSPYEKSYTIKEILKWFDDANLKITKILPIQDLNKDPNLFLESGKDIKNLQIKEILLSLNLNHANEGGLFTIIAKK